MEAYWAAKNEGVAEEEEAEAGAEAEAEAGAEM